MNGRIGQTASIAAYIKSFLRGNASLFDLEHSTARYCKKIEFVLEETDLSDKTTKILLAHSVMEWARYLAQQGVKDATLRYLLSSKVTIPDSIEEAEGGLLK